MAHNYLFGYLPCHVMRHPEGPETFWKKSFFKIICQSISLKPQRRITRRTSNTSIRFAFHFPKTFCHPSVIHLSSGNAENGIFHHSWLESDCIVSGKSTEHDGTGTVFPHRKHLRRTIPFNRDRAAKKRGTHCLVHVHPRTLFAQGGWACHKTGF